MDREYWCPVCKVRFVVPSYQSEPVLCGCLLPVRSTVMRYTGGPVDEDG